MGVSGLLPLLKPIQNHVSLEEYRGKTLAIDTYAWLHKAVFSCAMQLSLDQPTQAYINYVMKRIQMLNHFGITPYMVLDGDAAPTKKNTESERLKRREHHKQLALEAMDKKKSQLAMQHFQKACDVTPEMAKSLIEHLKLHGIKYVVAPYEADSQMVYLEKIGHVDGIISEDSDLLVFGCQTLLTKLNDTGVCIEIKRECFSKIKSPPFHSFSDDQIMMMAILSGCDYSKGIPGIGIQKSISIIKRFQTFKRLMMGIRFEGKLKVPRDFEEEYRKAVVAFRYPIVFNPDTQQPTNLNDLPIDEEYLKDEDFLISCIGTRWDIEIHQKVASGELNPFTKEPLISREILLNQSRVRPALRTFSLPGAPKAIAGLSPAFKIGRTRSLASSPTSSPIIQPSLTALKNKQNNGRRVAYTPRKRALQTIDSFFKLSPNNTKTASPSVDRKLSFVDSNPPKVDSMIKRRRILFGLENSHGTPDNDDGLAESKFFKSNSISESNDNKENIDPNKEGEVTMIEDKVIQDQYELAVDREQAEETPPISEYDEDEENISNPDSSIIQEDDDDCNSAANQCDILCDDGLQRSRKEAQQQFISNFRKRFQFPSKAEQRNTGIPTPAPTPTPPTHSQNRSPLAQKQVNSNIIKERPAKRHLAVTQLKRCNRKLYTPQASDSLSTKSLKLENFRYAL